MEDFKIVDGHPRCGRCGGTLEMSTLEETVWKVGIVDGRLCSVERRCSRSTIFRGMYCTRCGQRWSIQRVLEWNKEHETVELDAPALV